MGDTSIVAKPSKPSTETKITRISASDDGKKTKKTAAPKKVKPAVAAKPAKVRKETDDAPKRRAKNPFAPIWRYVKGSWDELMQVRWPDRRSTWGMTGALIAFTLFFVIIILLLDAGFQQLFNVLLRK